MSNLEFTSKFHQRVSVMYGPEKAAELIEEFDNLDPREANIFYRVFTASPNSPEHLHALTRVKSLVASGFISGELANLANEDSVAEAVEGADYEYILSRDALLGAIDEQKVNSDVLKNPYDEDGLLSRMVIRGNTKQEILDYINGKTFFQANKELAEAGVTEETTLADQQAILRFNDLMDALNNLEDPIEPVDFKAVAKEMVAPYDENGEFAGLIDSGSSSDEILEAMSENEKWSDDLYNYLTRYDVDRSTLGQNQKWAKTEETLYSLKDLDSL
jgi:hypothetical protein